MTANIIGYIHGCELTCPPCTAKYFDTEMYRKHKRDHHNVPFLAFDKEGHAVQCVFDEDAKKDVLIICDHCKTEIKGEKQDDQNITTA